MRLPLSNRIVTSPLRAILCASFLVLACGFAPAAEEARPTAEQTAFFEQQVRPLLVKHCYECHSAEAKILQGGLLLDSRPGWQKGGDSGPAIVVGRPDESLLVRAVQYDPQEAVHMPPQGKLSAAEIDVLAEWVRRGAPDPRSEAAAAGAAKRVIDVEAGRKHWAFQPLKVVEPPPVRNAAWCRTPVDRFILAKLEAVGIAPNPEADARTLLRRAYFDLVGLPPTPEEADKFIAEFPAEKSYAAILDALLASPHFGERWGRHWLDLARFAESHGFEQDYDRPHAYHYRDFVIDAFNRDLPYDTFVKWQLAGDEYAPENVQALRATGFLAAGVHATQITANQAEKERYDELDDMARTVGTTFLGLTVGCARCHDHKYDPISNADYYRIAATFTTTVRSDFDVDLDPAGYRTAKAAFDAAHEPLVAARAAYETSQLEPAFAQWLLKRTGEVVEPEWIALVPAKASASESVKLAVEPDGAVRSVGTQFRNVTYTVEANTKLAGITAVRLEAFADPSLPQGGPGTSTDGGFNLTQLKLTVAPPAGLKLPKDVTPPPSAPVEVPIAQMRATHDDAQPVGADERRSPNAWQVTSQPGRNQAAVFEFTRPAGYEVGSKLTFTLAFAGQHQGLGRFRLSVRTKAEPPPLAGSTMTEAALAAWKSLTADPQRKPTADERKLLFDWFCRQDAEWRKLDDLVERHDAERPLRKTQKMLISGEGIPAVRLHTQGPDFYEKTFVLRRGDPNQKVEEAQAGFLQVLVRGDEAGRWKSPPPAGAKTSYRRTALAEWLTDVEHGAGHLLARVIVNRLWHYHFGHGLVANPSDFGVQSGPPSHPELLDYLASELIRNEWRLKPIHKLLMTSAVYRQTTAADAARRKVDVENRLFWHRDLRRLEGEVLRDAMLALSGKMDATLFGPGTMEPGHPRRSIYFFFKRSKLPAMLTLFDGPDTLQDLAVRAETTVAPQALLLLNNTIVRGYAAGLAERTAPAGSADVESGIVRGYRLALTREPTADELRDSAAFVRAQSTAYRADGKRDEAESLAWTDFCQVLFGLNEFAYGE